MKPIGPIVGYIRRKEPTTEAEELKKLNNLRKHIIEAIKIISYYVFFFPFSFIQLQLKLHWNIEYKHLGHIWKSLGSVITRMC